MTADFRLLQRRFAAHLRDPDGNPAPAGTEERRLAIYRDLIFNNVSALLAAGFPVLRSVHAETEWSALVRAWLRDHHAGTPLFPQIGGDFVAWLQARECAGEAPAWVAELAHYEWIETELANAEAEIDGLAHARNGDLLDGVPLLSPLARPLVYRHAVHRIRTGATPSAVPDSPTCIIVFRDRGDRVGFLEANPLTLQLVERIAANDPARCVFDDAATGRTILLELAKAIGIDPDVMTTAGASLLAQLHARDIVPGTRLP